MFTKRKLGIYEKRRVSKKDAPTLFSVVIESKVYAWCPFCKEFHGHALSEGTHRNAHCDSKKSPFHETGYNILIFNNEK